MKTIEKECLCCKKTFQAVLREVKRGGGQYCTRSCSSKANGQKVKASLIPNCICAFCGISFYRGKTKKEISKSGLQFCSRICKDTGQRVESNILAIQPNHYGEGKTRYRDIAFRDYPHKCNRCGWKEIKDILEVHHKDCNRENNKAENLEILCPLCHSKHHYTSKTGKWKN